MRSLSVLITSLFLAATSFAQWTQFVYDGSSNVDLAQSAVDPAGNVYGIGSSDSGTDFNVLMMRSGPGGNVHWKRKLTGPGDQKGKVIALSPDGSQLYIGYERTGGGMSLVRINPASGAVVWNLPIPPPAGKTLRLGYLFTEVSASTTYVKVVYEELTTGVASSLGVGMVSEAGTVVAGSLEPLDDNRQLLDAALKPGGGTLYALLGTVPATANSAVRPIGGALINVPHATRLAVSPVGGGQVFAAGGHGTGSVVVYRIPMSTHTVASTYDQQLSGATGVAVRDLASDTFGAVYLAGSEAIPSFGEGYLVARHRHPDLLREWRNTRTNDTANESHTAIASDPWGTIAVALRRHGSLGIRIGFRVMDGITGDLLGGDDSLFQSGLPINQILHMSASDAGVFAGAGTVVDQFGRQIGVLLRAAARDLKHVSTPQASYTGGANISCTLWMYQTHTVQRNVNVATFSPLATAPSVVGVPAGALSKTFTITTQPTATDTYVTIVAKNGSTRHRKLLILAPRPSAVTVNPSIVQGGASSAGKVFLTGRAPSSGASVLLVSSGPEVQVPASVLVTVGEYQTAFTATTSSVMSNVSRTISASLNGTIKVTTLTVTP